MAYSFTAASSQYLNSTSPISGIPLTISCFFNSSDGATNQALIQVNNASGSERHLLAANFGTANTPLRCFSQTGGTTSAQSDFNGLTANTTYHAAGVYSATNSRTAYLNGVAATTNTTTINAGVLLEMTIGSREFSNVQGVFLNGMIAEVGIWNAALTAAEIASLAKGMTCDKIRPQSLVFYAPLVRDIIDSKGGRVITNNNGATVAIHPRVYA